TRPGRRQSNADCLSSRIFWAIPPPRRPRIFRHWKMPRRISKTASRPCEKPLCASCHDRMDPPGLALENFNAMGMWREKERGQTIDAVGKLITGETFSDIRELKHVLVTDRHADFYRCLTE